MLSLAISTLIPVFFVLGLGYLAGSKGIVDNKQVRSLNLLVMRFALPCALFVATAQTPAAGLRGELRLVVVLALSMWIVYALYYAFLRRLVQVPPAESSVQALTVALPNYAAVGLPLIVGVLGPKSAVDVAIAIATGAVLMSPVTLAILAREDRRNPGESSAARLRHVGLHVLTNPVVLGPIAGVCLSLCGVSLPTALVDSLNLIGKATPGAALFLTGLVLSAQQMKIDLPVLTGLVLKSLLQPAVALAIVILIGMHGAPARAAVLLTAIPSGFFGIMFGLAQDVRSPRAGSTLTVSSVAAVVTLAVAIILTASMP